MDDRPNRRKKDALNFSGAVCTGPKIAQVVLIRHVPTVVSRKKKTFAFFFLLIYLFLACDFISGRRTDVCISIDSPWR